MEFSASDQIRYKELLLQTYKVFDNFCKEHEIHFFAAGGTMIGAVRHQGFIPWDDDMDVYMKRADYDRFISLKDQLERTDYEIIDPENVGYYCAMAKFSYRNSTIWEFQGIPFVFGAYIDVFVLDYEDGLYEEVAKKRFNYAKMVNCFYICSNNHPVAEIKNLLFHGELKKSVWYVFQRLVLIGFYPFLRKLVVRHLGKKRGDWLVAYTGTSGKKDIFRSEWFDDVLSCPFEDTFIDVPVGYEDFLKAMFGDYMTPPPIEERSSHHSLFYYNLDRRISKEEIVQMQIG